MTDEARRVCPECNGEKKIGGTCVCDMEWRGTQQGDEWEDCQCIGEETCPVCHGTGYVAAD